MHDFEIGAPDLVAWALEHFCSKATPICGMVWVAPFALPNRPPNPGVIHLPEDVRLPTGLTLWRHLAISCREIAGQSHP
jgi:hypothetical protein